MSIYQIARTERHWRNYIRLPLSFAVLIHLTAKTSPRISGCQHALLLLLWSLLKDIQIKKEYM